MIETFFNIIELIGDWIWGVPGLLLLLGTGLVISFQARWIQIWLFPRIVAIFLSFIGKRESDDRGVHPLKVFFASIGGAIGLGNVVVIGIAVQLGGPGAVFWVWVTGLVGMILKYSEIFLGMRYRVRNKHGSYDGGPMFFLRKAFSAKWIPGLVMVLLCIYGVEIYMFSVMTDAVVVNWHINRFVVIGVFLALILLVCLGGVRRVGEVSTVVIPIFVTLYVGMAIWVLIANGAELPAMFASIFRDAFTGTAPIGVFAGSTIWIAATQGAAKGCYSGDIGVGYASVIHSESTLLKPQLQAALAVFGIFLDTFIVCSMSLFVILLTGVWQEDLPAAALVQAGLAQHFPYMNFFMPLFLCLLGYSTITAYFVVGLKCAERLSARFGRPIYIAYGAVALIFFSFFDTRYAFAIMTLAGGLLLLINLSGIFVLRKQVDFHIPRLKE